MERPEPSVSQVYSTQTVRTSSIEGETIKRILIAVAAIAALVGSVLAEQTNRVEIVWDEARLRDSVSVAALARSAEVAGVGAFLNQPTPENPYAYVEVNDYWTGNPGTNVVKIKAGNAYSTDWVFPTNTPIVFFAKTRGYVVTNNFSDIENPPPVDTTGIDLSELFFPHGDDAWFRTTRDNGLLYEFSTNLWDCLRINPNQGKFYEVLRDADKLPYSTSSRLSNDTYHELSFLFLENSDSNLIEKTEDPLIGEKTKWSIHNRLLRRGWSSTNGVYYPPSGQ